MSSVAGPNWPGSNEGRTANPSKLKTILFWAAMILLAVLLWKMASTPSPQPNRSFNSAELQSQIESKNIRSAHITVSRDRSLIDAERRDTPARFQIYVSNDFVPKLIQRLEESGADVSMQGGTEAGGGWGELLLDGVPFILLIVIFLVIMKQRQTRNRNDSAQARPIDV